MLLGIQEINTPEVKQRAERIIDLEIQKKEIDEEIAEITTLLGKMGVNTKAFKQVVKRLAKKDHDFCPYVGALSAYTDMFYGEESNQSNNLTFKGE